MPNKLLLLVLALATSPALELDRSILAKLARSGGKRDLLKPNHVQVKVTKTHDSSFFLINSRLKVEKRRVTSYQPLLGGNARHGRLSMPCLSAFCSAGQPGVDSKSPPGKNPLHCRYGGLRNHVRARPPLLPHPPIVWVL